MLHGLSSFDARALSSCGCTGLVALQRVESSQTREGTDVSCIVRQILYHWVTRGAPPQLLLSYMWFVAAAAAESLQLCPTVWPHRQQPTRLRHPWARTLDWAAISFSSEWKWKVKVSQSCPTLLDPMDCSPPAYSIHGIFQARVLEWDAIAVSVWFSSCIENQLHLPSCFGSLLKTSGRLPWPLHSKAPLSFSSASMFFFCATFVTLSTIRSFSFLFICWMSCIPN